MSWWKKMWRKVAWRNKHDEALQGQASSGHLTPNERAATFRRVIKDKLPS